MSTLLINGCSYAHAWDSIWDGSPIIQNFNKTTELGTKLGFDQTVNLGYQGGSNKRTFRTTMEYILENDSVEFVILMLTFWGRDEGPWAESIPIEGPWISHNTTIATGTLELHNRKLTIPLKTLQQYLDLQRLVDFDASHHCDTLITDLLCLIGWLKSRNIKYCIFGACDMEYSRHTLSPIKQRELLTDPGVINIFEWSSNKFLYESGARYNISDVRQIPLIRHYLPQDHGVLNDFLYNYITDNKLL